METLLLPLFGAIAGSYATYFFTLKKAKAVAIFNYKEKAYSALLLKVQAFLEGAEGSLGQKEFLEEIYRSWIYSSDDVVLAVNELLLLLGKPGEERESDRYGHQALGNLVVAIRKDLIEDTTLTAKSFRYFSVRSNDN